MLVGNIFTLVLLFQTTLGLVEIDAVRASDDEREIGTMNPHIRSIIAYNAESKVVESMRPNGVLMGQITPQRRANFRNIFYCSIRCLELGRCFN